MKKFKEIKDFSDADLSKNLEGSVRELSKLKFAHASSQIDNPIQIRNLRRKIARIKTEINSRINKKIENLVS